MLKRNTIIVVLATAAVVTAAVCSYSFFTPENHSQENSNQTYLASIYNNKEAYQDIFSNLQPAEETSAKAGVISHHFLAEQLIADFYNQVANDKISTVILLSPNHYNVFLPSGTVAYSSYLTWQTPLGNIGVNKEILDSLVKNNGVQINDSAMGLEHGIYIEVPFIKKFFPNAEIVPLVLKNNASEEDFIQLGEKLKNISGENSILIVSSDFSHEASFSEAKINDLESIADLKNIENSSFESTTNDCKQCLIAMSAFLNDGKDYRFNLIDNKNSFDISGEDSDSVTSYVSGFYAPYDFVQVLFVGDLMFDRGIRHYAELGGGNEFIFDKISKELLNNDLVVANLEGPITDNKSVSLGTAMGSADNYFFTFDPSVAKTLFQENIGVVDLGNNHILNFGYAGLEQTKNYLDKAGVSYLGVPNGQRSVIKDVGGITMAFVGYNEFLSSDLPAEQKAVVDEIKRIKDGADIVVVFCHWGVEYAPQPTEAQKELAHQFVDAGADLVIGSHPHVIQLSEEYNGKMIYYSLGNFIFDQYFNENVRNGLGVVVKINKTTKQLQFNDVHFYLDSNGQTLLR